MCTFTTWLLEDLEGEDMKMSFTAEEDPPTFYQTLSDKYKGNKMHRERYVHPKCLHTLKIVVSQPFCTGRH